MQLYQIVRDHSRLMKELEEKGLLSTYLVFFSKFDPCRAHAVEQETEMPFVRVLASMQHHGIGFDDTALAADITAIQTRVLIHHNVLIL